MGGRSPKNGGREGSWGVGAARQGRESRAWAGRGHVGMAKRGRVPGMRRRENGPFLSVTGLCGGERGEGTPTCLSLALEEADWPWLRVEMETQANMMSSPPNLVEFDIGDISPGLF